MNGKIKTKFAALFAVALMITVCVVPVVGNEDVQAASDDDVKTITVEGYVYGVTTSSAISGAEVTISGSNLISDTVVTNSSGKYSATLNYKQSGETNVKVTLNIGEKLSDGKANPAYGIYTENNDEISYGVTTSDKITGINFIAGKITISGSLYYKNGSGTTGKIGGTTVTLYEVKTGDSPDYSSASVTATSDEYGNYIMYVDANKNLSPEYTKFAVGATINKDSGIAYSSNFDIGTSNLTGKNITSEDVYVNIIKINSLVDDFEVSLSTAVSGEISFSSNSKSVKKGTTEWYVPFSVSQVQNGTMGVKIEGEVTIGGADYVSNKTVTFTTNSITPFDFTQSYISGTVKMGEVTANYNIITPSVNASIAGSSASISSAQNDGDKYYFFFTDTGLTSTNKMVAKVTASFGSVTASTNDIEVTGYAQKTGNNITLSDNGYCKVSGKVSSSTSVSEGTPATLPVGLTVTGADVFGNLTTDSNGNYSFMAPKNKLITITPAGSGYDYASKQINVTGDMTNVNFVMNTKTVDVLVKDTTASSAPMEGVTIYYTYTTETDSEKYTWTKASTVTDKDGKLVLTLAGNAVLSNLKVKAELAGRTFGAGSWDDTEPKYTISTNDTKITAKFIVGEEVVDLKDVSELPIVLSKVNNVFSKADYVLVKADDGLSAYFYGKTGDYYVYSADGKIGDYFLESIPVQISESITVTSAIAKGFVKDATNNPIVGATITLTDSDDVVIGSGVTNSVGHYEFGVTKDVTGSKVKVTNAGVYTFDETYSSGNITAKEGIFTGVIQDAADQPIYNADITVTSKATVDGQPYTSNVDALGKFKYIGIWNDSTDKVSTMLSAVDADSVYTFETDKSLKQIDLYGVTGTISYSANEATYKVTVPAKGLTVEIYNDSTTEGKTLVVGDLVSDKSNSVTVILEEKATYKAIAKSVEYGYKFVSYKEFSWITDEKAYIANVTASNAYTDLVLQTKTGELIKDAGYVVSSYNLSGAEYVKVGEATAVDGKVKIIAGAKYTVSSPEGALYTFGTESDPYANLAPGVIKANESVYSGSVLDAMGQYYLEGVTVTLKNSRDKIVGTSVTDKDGNFKVAAIEAVKVFAADADLAIGKFTFDENGVLFDNTNNTTPPIVDDQKYAASIFANETLYSGYYADGAVVKDVKVSYTDSTGAEALATVVDNKYYIVSLKPVTGSVTATATNFYAAGPLNGNLKVDAQKVPVYNIANSQNRDYVQIYAPSKIVYGTVITLAAQNEYSTGVPGEDGVIQKYKFAGWYVNGDKVSDELIYAYTVEGDCTIYADYKVSSYVAAPADESNGLSMDVLVLGIVIVVLGLLAFAYAVKFKKE